jgi:hypothetical protein
MNMAAMKAKFESGSTPTLAAPLTCPYFPGAATAFSTPPALTAVTVQVPVLVTQASIALAAPVAPASSRSRAHAGRGPPQDNLS